MPIGTTNAISGPYYGDGVVTAFPFDFQVLTGDQVSVYVDGVEQNRSAFSVAMAGAAPSIGTVLFIAAPPAGTVIQPVLAPSFKQDIEFADGAAWLADPVNRGYDESALRDQALARDIARSVRVPMGEDGISLPASSDRAGKVFTFGEDGDADPQDPQEWIQPLAQPYVDAAQDVLASTRAVAATLPYPLYASTAAAQADSGLLSTRQYTVLSGTQILIYTKNSGTASTLFGVIPTQPYVDRLKNRSAVPTIDFGAYGDGAHAVADQAGLAAAMAYAQGTAALPLGAGDTVFNDVGIVLEPGVYDAGAFVYAGKPINIRARVPHTVVIRIPAGQYFMVQSGNPTTVCMDGLIFVGGLGAYKNTNTGTNVSWRVEFTRCDFHKYTECAIQNAASDSPALHVKNCRFGGGMPTGLQTVGICWRGMADQTIIEDCYMGGNHFHIIIGPYMGSHVTIQRCYFQGGNDSSVPRTRADIWLKPNANGVETNSGHNSFVFNNRFGGELMNSAYPTPRILIANEDTSIGGSNSQYPPSTTNSAGAISGFKIFDNHVGNPSPFNAPFIRSYVNDVRYFHGRGNTFVGGTLSKFIEFPNGRSVNYSNNNNRFELDDTASNIPLALSNVPVGRLEDRSGAWLGDINSVPIFPVSDDPLVVPVAVGLSGYDLSYASGTTSVAVADPYGTNEYAAVTGLALLAFTDPYAGAGGPMFLEVSLSKAAANTLSYVTVDVVNTSNSYYSFLRTFPLPANGSPAKLMLPFYLAPNANPGSWQFRVYGSGIVAGSADTFVMGDMILTKGTGRTGRDKALTRFGGVQPANRRLVGGAAATLPSGWSMSGTPSGATITVTKVGTDKYGDFTEFSHTGTTTGSGGWVLRPAPQKSMSYEAGSNYRCIWPVRIISGDFSAATTQTGYDGSSGKLTMQVGSYSAADGLLVQRGIAFTPSSAFALYGRTLTEGAAYFHNTADYLWPLLNINYASGVTLNTVFRVYAPIFNRTK
ncbi:hypothetical protein FHW96_000299 [Novosphingobium sp. SG751A]|uniref:hypothetical protein n=1 Tax=Novosphingobium sp. SG751A TaxID=2587000 RepID=UPI00155266F1|nr:hypothetical protein [Novosphingobium sp. SG751A]NOW44172.1 hypothetical protein [Novosphingobium sp. SG751A]